MLRKIIFGIAGSLLVVLVGRWVFRRPPGKLVLSVSTNAFDMALSPDGTTLAIGQSRGIVLYDTKTGETTHIAESEALVNDRTLSWDSSGRYLYWVETYQPQRSAIFDVKERKLVAILDGVWAKLGSKPPAGTPLFLKQKGALKPVDLETGQVGSAIAGVPCDVLYVNAEDNRIVCGNDGVITESALNSGKTVQSVPGSGQYSTVSPDGKWLVRNRLGFYPKETETELVSLGDGSWRTVPVEPFVASAWRNGREVALDTIRDSDQIVVLAVTTGKYRGTPLSGTAHEVKEPLHWSSDGRMLSAITLTSRAYSFATFHHFDLAQYDPQSGKVSKQKLAGDPSAVAWDDANHQVYLVLGTNQLWVYQLQF